MNEERGMTLTTFSTKPETAEETPLAASSNPENISFASDNPLCKDVKLSTNSPTSLDVADIPGIQSTTGCIPLNTSMVDCRVCKILL